MLYILFSQTYNVYKVNPKVVSRAMPFSWVLYYVKMIHVHQILPWSKSCLDEKFEKVLLNS